MSAFCSKCGVEVEDEFHIYDELNEFGFPIVLCTDCKWQDYGDYDDLEELNFFHLVDIGLVYGDGDD